MASLNTSLNGPAIKSSYAGVVNGQVPASNSPSAARWALFSVQSPLANAFQDSGSKESVLKVQSTGGTYYVILRPAEPISANCWFVTMC